ncbi:MAG: DegT/DnrJ/EryC1/StrS family aminotransferase [Fuerstiella sp.]
MIPPLDLQAATDELRPQLQDVFARFLDSGRYVLGPEVEAFESEYAAFCGAADCVGVSSGLDALHLALRAAGIGPGDEVIVASNTYIATWLAVTHAGADVVPVEPDRLTHNIDPTLIPEKITSRTKAILATSLYGLPVDYEQIRTIAANAGLLFLTDNAQASGAQYHGRPVGGIADLECHSFYPTKNLGALGEAGAVTTSDPQFAGRLRMLRNYGSTQRYHHEIPGFNSRLDELQAGILRVKLTVLDEWNRRRRQIAAVYQTRLRDCRGIILPVEPDRMLHAWHLYVVQPARRDEIQELLRRRDIGTLIHYPVPPHRSPAYQSAGFAPEQFPVANALADRVLSLPMGPHLTEAAAAEVCDALVSVLSCPADEPRMAG